MEEIKGATAFVDYVMTVENLVIVVAVWTLIETARKMIPALEGHGHYARLKPLMPIVLCSVAVWIPGALSTDMATGSRIFLGIVLGNFVAHGHKVLKQTGLGHDERIGNGKNGNGNGKAKASTA